MYIHAHYGVTQYVRLYDRVSVLLYYPKLGRRREAGELKMKYVPQTRRAPVENSSRIELG